MEGERQESRQETYERIPWETLQTPRADRQWMVYLAAGAVVVAAIAYSLMNNRTVPLPAPQAEAPVPTTVANSTALPTEPLAPAAAPVGEAPVVMTEADLFAIDPERRRDQAIAHAEWFVIEYFTFDGSEISITSLAGLMPVGVPLPEVDESRRVFIESARATSSDDIDGLSFRVDVLVRWLLADGDATYVAQPPLLASVVVEVGEEGPRVSLPPTLGEVDAPSPAAPALIEVPPAIATTAMEQSGAHEVIGGLSSGNGGWRVVVMAPGPDGILRPQTVMVP